MSLSESLFGELPDRAPSNPNGLQSAQSAQPPSERESSDHLAEALTGMFLIQETQRDRSPKGNVIVFRGKLVADSEAAYPVIAERFKQLGYTAMLDHVRGLDVVAAVEGLQVGRKMNVPNWVHLALLLLTMCTTILSGANFTGHNFEVLVRELQRGNFGYIWTIVQYGAPFALTLLLILGVHEMGHYIAARRHGVDVTLPFFIPVPLISLLGTLGAVIFIKSPLTNRKSLFDVGISGPLAGFVVALAAFIISMGLQPNAGFNRVMYEAFGSDQIGMPPLLHFIGNIAKPNVNLARFVVNQPVAFAAWFGMLLTMLNLIPIGQLDGGHILYTLFGRAAWSIAYICFAGLIFLGLTGFPSFLVYAFLALLTGLRHPPPNDDLTPLGWRRTALGYATIVLFFLILTVNPFPIR